MERESAERLAIGVLGWLGGEPEPLGRFLAETGAGPEDLRARAGEPEFLGFVLDHLMADEEALMRCTAELGTAPEAIARPRAGLPGGDLPHWT